MTPSTFFACALLAIGAPDEAKRPDQLALADFRVATARLGRDSANPLVEALRAPASVPAGWRRDSLRMAPWLGPTVMAQLMMHESAHALVPFLRGDETVRVRFFPDVRARRFGEATWSTDGPLVYDALSSAMPKLLDLAVITAVGRAKRSARSSWSRGILGAIQIVALGDFLQGTLTVWRPPGRWNDAWYLTQRLDDAGVHLGREGARTVMTVLAAAGVGLFAANW